MEVFFGISAADGAGIGPAFIIPDREKRVIPQKKITPYEIDEGWIRFEEAISVVVQDVKEKLSKLPKDEKSSDLQKEIFETYILMLADPVFLKEVKSEYQKSLLNIEWTINYKAEEYATRLRNAGNEYLAERAQDITDIFGKVIDEMLNIHPFDINQVPDGCVIVAKSLSPTDTIILSKRRIEGLALTEGGVSSHVVILARNYGIPTVVGLNGDGLKKSLKNDQVVIVDADGGEILVEPDSETLDEYKNKIAENQEQTEQLKHFLDKKAATKDGVEFSLYANIGTPEEAEIAAKEGADGIGLFRTEFLYMSRSEIVGGASAKNFDEEQQFEAYKKVLEIMNGKPVTIRTLDAGGDKLIKSANMPAMSEKNPLMGMRAIRLSLAYPQILKTQLRALYRASVYGNLRIMLPLITSTEQVTQCLDIAADVRESLASENIPFNPDVPIGIMIETAAAALTSDCLAKKCAFFSLGTNDLTQYTLAIDRENSYVSELYDEFNLAVLRLISMTINNAAKENIPISVCGEMASRKDSVIVLGGLGIRSLSMSPKIISKVKQVISQFTLAEMQAISSQRLNRL